MTIGEAFKEWGIENFLEEDCLSWLVRGEAQDDGMKLAWELLRVLERYDLSKLTRGRAQRPLSRFGGS